MLKYLSLTEERATVSTIRQMFVENEKEHGEAQDQCDLESVALSSFKWQSKAHHIGKHYKCTGQDQSHKGTKGVDRQGDLFTSQKH